MRVDCRGVCLDVSGFARPQDGRVASAVSSISWRDAAASWGVTLWWTSHMAATSWCMSSFST